MRWSSTNAPTPPPGHSPPRRGGSSKRRGTWMPHGPTPDAARTSAGRLKPARYFATYAPPSPPQSQPPPETRDQPERGRAIRRTTTETKADDGRDAARLSLAAVE